MGSNVTKPRQRGVPVQRKSALKHGPPRPTRHHMARDPFGTEVFRPNETHPETLASQADRSYPTPRPEAPIERPNLRVHYEDGGDVPIHRDEMLEPDTDRPNRPINPRLGGRPLPGEMDHMDAHPDYSPRRYRPPMPYYYYPRPVARRPRQPQGYYTYPYRSMPPSIYPYRPRAPRPVIVPVPVDDRYRPAPVPHHSPRALPVRVAVPVSNQPPPYHAVDPISYRQDYNTVPREQPRPNPAEENTIPRQGGGVTDRQGGYQDNTDRSNQDIQVASLLSPGHITAVPQPAGDPKPKSEESIHAKDDDVYIGANLKFYRNQMKFRPNGETIDYIHKYWYGNYALLEKLNTYIQWLFPLYDKSRVNLNAVPLRAHEAKHIYEDPDTRNRFVTSFLMMLDFYGFSMTDEETGKIERAANWKERFNNLRRSHHNLTRITRILRSLGELGQSKLQAPFVMALFHEVFETQELAGIPPATLQHWLRCINDDFEREYVYKQFKKGLTRLEEERRNLKRKDDNRYYFEMRKPLDESNKDVEQLNARKKLRI